MMPRGDTAEVGQHHKQTAGVLGQGVTATHLPQVNYSDAPEDQYMADANYKTMEEAPKPTGMIAWVGFGLGVFGLACNCISFASPYWLQTWPNSFNSFQNMGLWEVCFHNYMHHRDDKQEIFNGCWWVFNTDEKYRKLREWLLPPWFITCQVMAVMCLLIQLTVCTVVCLVFLHMCPINNHEYHQIFATFISGAMMFLVTVIQLIMAIIYGSQCGDRNWMPRPDWNFMSWGFGFLIISAMMSLAAGICLFLAASRAYEKLQRQQDEYFKQALEMSTMYPATNSSEVTYGPVSYASQSNYEKGSMPTDSYGQPSYTTEEKPYDEKAGYDYGDKGYDRQQSYGGQSQHGDGGDGQQGYGQPQEGYAAQQYDPQGYGGQPEIGQQYPQQYEGGQQYDGQGGQQYAPPSYNGYEQGQGGYPAHA